MIYNFQLHRITLILIVALLGVGGGLLFFSGLLVGVSWHLPKPAADGATAAAPAAGGDAPEATRRAVSLPAGFAAPTVAAPTVAAPAVTAPAFTAPTVTAPAVTGPAVTGPAVTGPAVTRPTFRQAPLPLSAEAVHFPGNGESAEEPAAGPATAEPSVPAPPPAPRADPLRGLRKEDLPMDGFALQVGAFSQSENTQRLIQELAARGFEPYVVRTATRASRQVESVRIGHFSSRSEAAAAGTELARAEGIHAFVVRASGIVP